MSAEEPRPSHPGDPLAPSGYVDVDAAPEPLSYVRRLESSGASPYQSRLAQRSMRMLDVRRGARLLEVGCGTGMRVAELAAEAGSEGEVVGLDRSTTMLEACHRLLEQHPHLPARFVCADARQLPFASASFDGCRSMRTLLHIEQALAVVAVMGRVVRPGGNVVLVEPDYGAATIEGGNQELTQRLVAARVAHFAQGRAGLWLAAWAARAGLEVLARESHAQVSTSWDQASEQLYRDRYLAPACALGTVTEDEARAWLEELRQAAAQGRYRHRSVATVLHARRLPD